MSPETKLLILAGAVTVFGAWFGYWIHREPKDHIRLPRKTLWERTREFLKEETQ